MRALLVLALSVAGLVACAGPLAPGPTRAPTGPCAARFPADRCAAITGFVVQSLGVAPAEVRSVIVEDEPSPSMSPGQLVIRSGGGQVLLLHVDLTDGRTATVKLWCVGVAPGHDPACMDQPRVPTSASGGEGYRDTPEGSTPLPSLEPSAIAAGQPLGIPRQSIAVGRTGRFTVELGSVRVPNGVLTTGRFELADPWPDGILFTDAGIRLVVTPLDPDGRPFDNVFVHGWRPGVEAARVTLEFEVLAAEPGASFEIVGVAVA